ncbi:hypothetical protein [Streptomyces sp. 1331.2]|uniref:hypothetical protein n=1 Tax=Streptomyces sp. 1331.2 TaxID=1938835 RepID=UPI000BC621FD|nr:hypothetical protein [Streptomyces sp. 1331.2]SOB88673.1 hypothetical protein SAMN06272789_6963 [Streptomyces sp. 1331.2]
MATTAARKKVRLEPDDHARMQRLHEEVTGRLEEMSMIVSRTLGLDITSGKTLKWQPAGDTRLRGNVDIEIVCTPDGCGCYDYRDGTCSEC